MNLTPDDIAADFADVVDNLATVVYQRRTSEATWDTPGFPVLALERAPVIRGIDLPEGGHIEGETVAFHLAVCDMVSPDPDHPEPVVPSHGDRLVEGQDIWLKEELDPGASYWLVEEADVVSWKTRYKVTCRKFVG